MRATFLWRLVVGGLLASRGAPPHASPQSTSFGALSHDDTTIPRGGVLGGHLSAQFDVRLEGFVISAGVQYRLLMPLEAAPNGGPTSAEHALSGTIGLGFGFWD